MVTITWIGLWELLRGYYLLFIALVAMLNVLFAVLLGMFDLGLLGLLGLLSLVLLFVNLDWLFLANDSDCDFVCLFRVVQFGVLFGWCCFGGVDFCG